MTLQLLQERLTLSLLIRYTPLARSTRSRVRPVSGQHGHDPLSRPGRALRHRPHSMGFSLPKEGEMCYERS